METHTSAMPSSVLIRAAVATALLFCAVTMLSATDSVPAPSTSDVGGPVYPNDKNVGGGPRAAPWSVTIVGNDEPGERLTLTGTVYGREDGKPRQGVTVYAYHTDAKGYYGGKPWGPPRLRGWARTDAEGRYEFRTIKPGPYPLRQNPAHVHMTIAIPGKTEWWIPELRFGDDPFLSGHEVEREAQRGTFASIRSVERQADGTMRCVRDIRLPPGW